MERIDQLKIPKDAVQTELFLSGPIEFLCIQVVEELKKVPQWQALFGKFIDSYKRMDYGFSNLPALRIYWNRATKESESWFINGDLICDLIFPASVRRNNLEQYADTVSAALLQQFRRTKFFDAVSQRVPGLNELGRRLDIDKSLAFDMGEDLVPLTQINVNFRLDLRIWDDFLTSQDRTIEDPFEKTIGDLLRAITKIRGVDDEGVVKVEITSSQKPGQEGS